MKSMATNAPTTPVDPPQGGYSDRRLWPCYMLGSAIAMSTAPFIGAFLAMVLVAIPALYFAIKINAKEEKDPQYAKYDIAGEIFRDIEKREKQRVRASKKAAARVARQKSVAKKQTSKVRVWTAARYLRLHKV